MPRKDTNFDFIVAHTHTEEVDFTQTENYNIIILEDERERERRKAKRVRAIANTHKHALKTPFSHFFRRLEKTRETYYYHFDDRLIFHFTKIHIGEV